ncbi:GMC family oxidoreductase [Sinirhodobacter populi]|uniref:GMC family oxidoreductase n=2 Tax=Paenirhodobacter populi TaxID=2306993 RepID=A0A443JKL9_9RHOB|nr:GMC family oxidoreductase [Sinirhodobacter populi]
MFSVRRVMAIVEKLDSSGRIFDTCVIGSGPAGLAVALSLEANGCPVLLLEAGGDKRRSQPPPSPEIRIEDPSVHAPLAETTRQRLGGTSSAWGTICVPYDPIDFEHRDWVTSDGWPIPYDEVARWYDEAGAFLGFGPEAGGAFVTDDGLVLGAGRLANRAPLMVRHRDRIRHSRNLTVLTSSPVTDLQLAENGERVHAARVRLRDGTVQEIAARRFIIAGGGLRSTYLLLRLARQWPQHFCAGRAPLGRYYMGHLTGEIAGITFRSPQEARDFLFQADAYGVWTQKRFLLRDECQRETRTLNTAFMLRPPTLSDPGHGSGALSLAYLAARIPGVAPIAKSTRLTLAGQNGTRGALHAHFANALRRPGATAREIGVMGAQSLKARLPILIPTPSGRYSLRFHAEQMPNAESRVLLSDAGDPADPGLDIRFRYRDEDFSSVLATHHALAAALAAGGRAKLDFYQPPEERIAAIRAQALDGYHQIGTTRMGDNPRESVVDRNCRVHGLDNLFMASSSVFPTSGSANPTFTIVALARRLGDHIARLS